MAAVKLVTRCPACRTAFRLVADQLRLRQGLVRCGNCDTVFDAREHLIEVPVQSGAQTPVTPTSAPTSAPAPQAPSEANAKAPASRIPDFDPGYDPGYDVPALDAPTMMLPTEDAGPATPDEASEAEPPAGSAPASRGEAEEAAAQAQASRSEAEEAAPDAPADAAQATSASPEADNAAAVSTANGKPHDSEATAGEAEPIAPAHAPWPALDHAALGEPEPQSVAAEAPPADKPVRAEAAAPAPAAPILHSASEFLRARSSDEASGKPGPAQEQTSPAREPESESESDRDYSHNYFPTYGPEVGNAFGATAEAVAREQATRRWARLDEPTGPVFAPDFLRQSRERERERARQAAAARLPGRRAWLWAAAAVLGTGVLAQGIYLARSQLAGHFPMLRPALEAACAPLGCDVPPWRDIDALRIDTSQLQKQDEGGDSYVLAVTLRNQGRATTALPAIELVMTDLQDQLLLRRVLQPSEYLDPEQKALATQGLRAGMELPVRVRFRTQQVAANYRVLIFYP